MMSKKELILKVLDSLNSASKVPSKEELGLDKEQYGEILEIMQHDNLIFGATITRSGQGNPVQFAWTDNVKITIRGIDYLEKNKTSSDFF